MRVWIEMSCFLLEISTVRVTLRVRVWIEIRERPTLYRRLTVTLRVRVWIEIFLCKVVRVCLESHPPCEGVD